MKELKVVDVGINSITLSWKDMPGASGYKVSWIPFLGVEAHTSLLFLSKTAAILHFFLITFPAPGGDQKSHVVSGASRSFTINKLRESSSYKVQLSTMVGKREGSPVLVTARTCESCLLPYFPGENYIWF